jgi:large subunit ribosomal protein L35
MPKHKTKKSVKKRIRVSKTGKVMRSRAGRRHLNSSHDRKTIRNLNRKVSCAPGDAKKMLRMLGNIRP